VPVSASEGLFVELRPLTPPPELDLDRSDWNPGAEPLLGQGSVEEHPYFGSVLDRLIAYHTFVLKPSVGKFR
jgi:hypothetical protein